MVDLTKLEQEIDNLLESETKATFEKWLFNKRSYSSVTKPLDYNFNAGN